LPRGLNRYPASRPLHRLPAPWTSRLGGSGMAASIGCPGDRTAGRARSAGRRLRMLLVVVVTFVLGVLLGAALPGGGSVTRPAAPAWGRALARPSRAVARAGA